AGHAKTRRDPRHSGRVRRRRGGQGGARNRWARSVPDRARPHGRQRDGGGRRQRAREARAVSAGKLIGVGGGPGDPELMTLKAIRALGSADVVAHFAKNGNGSNGRTIAAGHVRPGVEEIALLYPVTTEIPKCEPAYRDTICQFYDTAATTIADRLNAGRTVAVICEGDPLF